MIVPPIVAFGLFLSLALVVILRDFRRVQYRLFALFLAGMGAWGLITFALRTSSTDELALIWARALFPASSLASAAFLHFTFLHTRMRAKWWLIAGIYIIVLAVTAVAFTNLLVTGMTKDVYGYLPISGPLHSIVSIVSYAFLIIGLINLTISYRRSKSYEEKNSYIYIIIGIVISMIGGGVDYLSLIGLGVPPVGQIGNILFGLLATIAILRYHLLDINIVIRKSVAYLLTSTVVAIPIVGVILLFNQVFGKWHLTIWISLILLLIVAIALQAIWHWAQNLVDRMFFRQRYDFLRELERFSHEVHDISNLNKLGLSLVDLIGRALQTTGVQLFVSDESGYFNLIASTGQYVPVVSFQNNSPLIRWLSRNKEILYRHQVDVIPQLQSLTSKERTILATMGVELFIPLRNNKDELIGVLTIAKKRSEQPYTGDDIRRISTVSNRVAIELENARLYARETSMRMEMQRQNEQKTEFLHHVAHELKTPLTAIISSSELVTSDELMVSAEQKERLLTNINRSAWLMDKRVGELLDLARIQIGTLELKLEPVDVNGMAHDLTSQLSALFKNKEQTIEVDIQETLPKARADKERVEEILINLLSNANKFSPAQGKIIVRASTLRNRIMVEVKDSAPLISDEDKMKIFNAYYRGGTDEDRQRISGLGLGLAISKSLIELHHGEIGVKNEDNSGNIFYFTLPVWGVGDEKQTDSTLTDSQEGG
jgi:signal transduction histidine kinase